MQLISIQQRFIVAMSLKVQKGSYENLKSSPKDLHAPLGLLKKAIVKFKWLTENLT